MLHRLQVDHSRLLPSRAHLQPTAHLLCPWSIPCQPSGVPCSAEWQSIQHRNSPMTINCQGKTYIALGAPAVPLSPPCQAVHGFEQNRLLLCLQRSELTSSLFQAATAGQVQGTVRSPPVVRPPRPPSGRPHSAAWQPGPLLSHALQTPRVPLAQQLHLAAWLQAPQQLAPGPLRAQQGPDFPAQPQLRAPTRSLPLLAHRGWQHHPLSLQRSPLARPQPHPLLLQCLQAGGTTRGADCARCRHSLISEAMQGRGPLTSPAASACVSSIGPSAGGAGEASEDILCASSTGRSAFEAATSGGAAASSAMMWCDFCTCPKSSYLTLPKITS